MARAIPNVLATIVAAKRSGSEAARPHRERWEKQALERGDRRDFRSALGRAPAIIAEIKQASPSKGVLVETFDPAGIAGLYEEGGAAALSVLTDGPFFQGSLGHLESARKACALPVLRKDFTLEEVDIAQAAAHGADAVLLIAALHSAKRLRELREYASRLGLDALVEVHDAAELEVAIESGAAIIGVNNRDLRTFEVSLDTSLRLAASMPAGALRVSESGIHSRQDVQRLLAAGFQAFLVGEHLMKSASPPAALRALLA